MHTLWMPFEGDDSFQSFAVPYFDLGISSVLSSSDQYIFRFGYAYNLVFMTQIMSLFSWHPVI